MFKYAPTIDFVFDLKEIWQVYGDFYFVNSFSSCDLKTT